MDSLFRIPYRQAMAGQPRTMQGVKAPLRRDALARRERLLRAARELFMEGGVDVPLERIADRAQVGRATLYRNFPDRTALTAAMVETYVDELRREIDRVGEGPDAFFDGIRIIARLTVSTNGFEKSRWMRQDQPHIYNYFRSAIEDVLAKPLEQAKAAGLIRSDIPIAEAPRIALMVAGGGLHDREVGEDHALERAMEMLMQGLRP